MKLSIIDKYHLVQNYYAENGEGAIFDPQTATHSYGVNFLKDLKLDEDYKTVFAVIHNQMGASPALDIYFTLQGIEKLLRQNKAMRKEVKTLYDELIAESVL